MNLQRIKSRLATLNRIALTLPVVLAITAIGMTSRAGAATDAQIYLSPSTGSVTVGSNVVVSLVVNSGSSPNSIGTVQSILSYTSNLTYVSTSVNTANFTQASVTPSSGSVGFSMYVTPGSGTGGGNGVNGTYTVATFTFQANTAGTGRLTLAANAPAGNHSSSYSDAYDISTLANDLGTVGGPYSYTINAPVTQPSGGGGGTSGGGTSGGGTSTSGGTKSSGSSTKSSSTGTTGSTPATPAPTAAANNPVPQISNVTVGSVGGDSATITWQTNLPSTSTVNFGLGTNYGISAGSKDLTTNHSVSLDATYLKPNTKYYFEVSSATSIGASNTSSGSQFTTTGLTMEIKVVNKAGKPVSGALVTIDGKSVKTNSNGIASFSNISPGNTNVTIQSGSKTTKITTELGQYSTKDKSFQTQITLTAATSGSSLSPALVVLILLVLLAALFYLAPISNKSNLLKFNKGVVANSNLGVVVLGSNKAVNTEPVPQSAAKPVAKVVTPTIVSPASPPAKPAPKVTSSDSPGNVVEPDKKE